MFIIQVANTRVVHADYAHSNPVIEDLAWVSSVIAHGCVEPYAASTLKQVLERSPHRRLFARQRKLSLFSQAMVDFFIIRPRKLILSKVIFKKEYNI